MEHLELELEEPDENEEAWNLVEQEYGNDERERKLRDKISKSFHSNTKVSIKKENKTRLWCIAILSMLTLMSISLLWKPISIMDETKTSHAVRKDSLHSNTFGSGLKNESMTNKFYESITQPQSSNFGTHASGEPSTKHIYKSKHLQNELNMQAYYLHDENSSPFASNLYTKYDLGSASNEQDAYEKKMNHIREKYGSWNFYDHYDLGGSRPIVDTYDEYPNRDVPASTFPKHSWQSDSLYVNRFIDESLKLIKRVRVGIYEEYGYGSKSYSEEALRKLVGVHIFEPPHLPSKDGRKGHYKVNGESYDDGIAWMTKSGYDALVRKLLHSMMTNDDFYVVLAGHSAAAGHGNQFFQTKSMQFHFLMEPIFDKLGMNLITRNMAMGGLGTIQSSLAGSDIYGERDFLIWDSAMTEGNNDAHDVFNRQALMSGERVPVIMIMNNGDMSHKNLRKALEDAIEGGWWHGDFHEPENFIPYSDEVDDLDSIPSTTKGLKCNQKWDTCMEDRYASKCWIDRNDITPAVDQSNQVPSQVSWHPGWRHHRWEARKWTLLMLDALETALSVWGDKTNSEGHPLPDKYWHIGDRYEKIREAVRTSPIIDENEETCESKIFSFIPRICRTTPISAATEFTPRADPDESSIRKLIVPAPNGYVPHLPSNEYNLYDGPNLLLPDLRTPDGEVDVHAIAIASTNKTRTSHRRRLKSNKEKSKKGDEGSKAEKKENEKPKKDSHSKSVSTIVPGRGWSLYHHPAGFCDGTAQSECNRGLQNNCLLYEHNDAHGGILGDGLSGWLVMRLDGMKAGIVIARIESWIGKEANSLTKDWREINNGMTHDETPYVFPKEVDANKIDEHDGKDRVRSLKGQPDPLPDNFVFEIAINGEIKSKWSRDEFEEQRHSLAHNLDMFVLMDDPKMSEKLKDEDNGKTVEVAIRLSGIKREATFSLTHIYWA